MGEEPNVFKQTIAKMDEGTVVDLSMVEDDTIEVSFNFFKQFQGVPPELPPPEKQCPKKPLHTKKPQAGSSEVLADNWTAVTDWIAPSPRLMPLAANREKKEPEEKIDVDGWDRNQKRRL